MKSLFINLKKVKYNFNEIAFYYIKSLFSAGHIATVRSESQNNVFKTGFRVRVRVTSIDQVEISEQMLASIDYPLKSNTRYNQLLEIANEIAAKGSLMSKVNGLLT